MMQERYEFVSAIFLNTRGFAFVVFEGELAPLDWGVVEVRGTRKSEKNLARIEKLLARCRPQVVVLQKLLPTDPRPERIFDLNGAVAALARRGGFPKLIKGGWIRVFTFTIRLK
jgi:hypothetical protein